MAHVSKTDHSNVRFADVSTASDDNPEDERESTRFKHPYTIKEVVLIQLLIANIIVFLVIFVFFIQYYNKLPKCETLPK